MGRTPEEVAAMGLSSDCTLNKLIVLAIMLRGDEHPCDRCNMDRKTCRGYPRRDDKTDFAGIVKDLEQE